MTAGWGRYGAGEAVMQVAGHVVGRAFMPEERTALGDILF